MTAVVGPGPVSPQRLLADELPGTAEQRWDAAGRQLAALAEHGYAVVSVFEPDDEEVLRREVARADAEMRRLEAAPSARFGLDGPGALRRPGPGTPGEG